MTDDLNVKAVITKYRQWKFDAPDSSRTNLRSKNSFGGPADRNYNLFNNDERRYLQWEKQTWGINIGWTDDATSNTAIKVRRWFFDNRGPDTQPIHYGETIALGNGGDPSFLRYAERTVGINLKWSDDPVHEWRILGGRIGAPVLTGDSVAIFNEVANDFFIFFDRSLGGDIGWPTSQTFGEQLSDIAKKAAMDAAKTALIAGVAA